LRVCRSDRIVPRFSWCAHIVSVPCFQLLEDASYPAWMRSLPCSAHECGESWLGLFRRPCREWPGQGHSVMSQFRPHNSFPFQLRTIGCCPYSCTIFPLQSKRPVHSQLPSGSQEYFPARYRQHRMCEAGSRA